MAGIFLAGDHWYPFNSILTVYLIISYKKVNKYKLFKYSIKNWNFWHYDGWYEEKYTIKNV